MNKNTTGKKAVSLRTSVKSEAERSERVKAFIRREDTQRYRSPKPIPKGAQLFYFNTKGEYSTSKLLVEGIVYEVIALNENNAKAKFHKWAAEHLKTADEWVKAVPEAVGLRVIDNFHQESEGEKMTRLEFCYRLGDAVFDVRDERLLKMWYQNAKV